MEHSTSNASPFRPTLSFPRVLLLRKEGQPKPWRRQQDHHWPKNFRAWTDLIDHKESIAFVPLNMPSLSISGTLHNIHDFTRNECNLKGGVAATVIFLSASTTAALHWFVSAYIHKLKWKPGSATFDVEMMSWLAMSVTKTIKFSVVRPPETNRPFIMSKADGNFYSVDAEHCDDKTLLVMLTPQKPAHESAFKNL